MESLPYISGLKAVERGPLARFLPPLEDGTVSTWLSFHVPPSQAGSSPSWLLDPFGFSPRLVIEAARAGYRVLVTVNNPVTRFLLEMAANPCSEADFRAALADLAVSKKGDERLEAHLQSLYLTTCEKCGREIQAETLIWRKGEDAPFARTYKCKECGDEGERPATPQDVERARKIAATDSLHRSRAFERVAALDDEDRVYAEEAIQHYLPRPLYALTTILNRLENLYLTPERQRALSALILAACDAGNTLWAYPTERPRPKLLSTPNQFREHNIWMMLERAESLWKETAAQVTCVAWPNKIPEGGGICIYEGRLKDLAHQVKKEIPIAAVIGSVPRPNQAFWTLSALWAGWLWGRQAVEPYSVALRRRRYDWAWNATALNATFNHLFELVALGTPCFGLLPEAEPPFLTSALLAANAADFHLKGLALRTEHDPIQLTWERGEHLTREASDLDIEIPRRAMVDYLAERGEPVRYLHLHAVALLALIESHVLRQKDEEFDEALRRTQTLIETALKEDTRFVHHSTGEGVDTGLWGLNEQAERPRVRQEERLHLWQEDYKRNEGIAEGKAPVSLPSGPGRAATESLLDRLEVAIVNYLQKNPESIYLEIENEAYRSFPGLLTPSKGMIYAILDSYAEKDGASWKLRAEDAAAARQQDLRTIGALIETIGKRLKYKTHKQEKWLIWEENEKPVRVFNVLASALVERAIAENPHPFVPGVLVIPGGRAALVAYKAERNPALAERLQAHLLTKYRLWRALSNLPILTRETLDEQLSSDPIEQAKGQMMMF